MTPTDHVRRMFAAFDSKDVWALAPFMIDDVRLRLGNAEPVEGKSAFRRGGQRVPRVCRGVSASGVERLERRGRVDRLVRRALHPPRRERALRQRVPAPGRLGCGVPQLDRCHARVLLMRL